MAVASISNPRIGIGSEYHVGRLFNMSCVALLAAAWIFALRASIMSDLSLTFGLSMDALGSSVGTAFLAFGVAVFVGSPLCDYLGMGRLLFLAFVLHLVGACMLIFAPSLVGSMSPIAVIVASQVLVGLAHGLIEAVINPLAATIYPDNKTHKLNVLHAWWPGGLALGGLVAVGLQSAAVGWQGRFAVVLFPIAVYGFMLLGLRFPPTERKASNVSEREMFREVLRPSFLILLFAMLFTASLELGPGQWVDAVLTKTVGFPGILVLVYVSTLMFVFRFFAGALAHKFSPIGLMFLSSVGAGLGLLALSFAQGPVMGVIAATLWGMGVCYMWPTMLGIAGERFPRGGALAMGLIGACGSMIINYGLKVIGQIYDHYTVKALPAGEDYAALLARAATDETAKAILETAKIAAAPYAFRWVSLAALVPLVVFSIWWIMDNRAGGYRAVKLGGEEPAAEGEPQAGA